MSTVQDEIGSLYTELPYNGLATSSEIILNQLKDLDIDIDGFEPDGDDSHTDKLATLTEEESALFDPRRPNEQRDAIRSLMAQASVPIDKYAEDDPIKALYGGTTSTKKPTAAPGKLYDGPKDQGNSFGDVLTSYGLPTTFGQLLSDAEEAFSGIMYDLNHIGENSLSVYEIFAKNNRLRGLGAIFIIIALAGILLNNLLIRR